MDHSSTRIAALLIAICWSISAFAQEDRIPEPLKPWKDWVLWDGSPREIPHPYNDPKVDMTVWPSTLRLRAEARKATWAMNIRVFRKTRLAIPGDKDSWPRNVRVRPLENGTPGTPDDFATAVLPHEGVPSVELPEGNFAIEGEFEWSSPASKVAIPRQIGMVQLTLDGVEVPFPNWDATGFLWLSRQQSETAEQNRMSVKVYRYLEDGIPSWLYTKVELTVSGKNREEDLGHLLPDGWLLAKVDSLIPLAVDEQGGAKVQVRPGNWTLDVTAFRVAPLDEFRFADGTTPLVDVELIGLKTQPQFRLIELVGPASIDVQQTTFPDAWRSLPVFQWSTSTPFKIVEKIRGMGSQKPTGYTVSRRFWLDDDGRGITYQDSLSGHLQQSWRLDAAPDHQLGAVKINQERQLITANPSDGRPGVELRSRSPNVVALGRIEKSTGIPATGWLADVDRLRLALSLPPGWRVWAVLGADKVQGDWLTAWTLMDLFLLLLFAIAIYRLYGVPAGLLALLAIGLSYHEPFSPRWTWIVLLIPIALLRVLPDGSGKRVMHALRWAGLGFLLVFLVPFIAKQIEFAIYPQLESSYSRYGDRSTWFWEGRQYAMDDVALLPMESETDFPVAYPSETTRFERMADSLGTSSGPLPQQSPSKIIAKQAGNMMNDPAARTQTGPALPKWTGNTVYCSWDGPVSSEQRIVPIYLSRNVHRCLAVVRSVFLLLLLAVLASPGKWMHLFPNVVKATKSVGVSPAITLLLAVLSVAMASSSAFGQIPNSEILRELKERLSKPSDAYPQAADIASLDLTLEVDRLRMIMEIHAAERVAIPLPGKFPSWSPQTLRWDSSATETSPTTKDPVVARGMDGTLWLLANAGVQRIVVEGLIPDSNEWVLGFPLTPRRITVEAPDWQVVGLQGSQAPGNQLFFSKIGRENEQTAKFDQRLFRPVVQIERRLEIGLIWKVYTKVMRLSAPGKAISLTVPLLAEERVVSSSIERADRTVEVNLEPDQSIYTWESELNSFDSITLKAAVTDQYVERWVLEGSPVWNIEISGIQPHYESAASALVPVWQVWPGEQITLNIKRPEAIPGETLTVQNVERKISLGTRQRRTELSLDVESSLGGEFRIGLAKDHEVKDLSVNQRPQPVRRDGNDLIVTLEPGLQKLKLSIESDEVLGYRAEADSVRLPAKSANVQTVMAVPENRWILWADGPLRGPAVRLWIFLASAILLTAVLSLRGDSPLQWYEWLLLALGLTQLHAIFGLMVVGWLYLLHWRRLQSPESLTRFQFNFVQVIIVLLTLIVFVILIAVVGKGLLGQPEMFIMGNGSYFNSLQWFEPQSGQELSQPYVLSVSIWFYRLLMLLWALWLASALLRWLIRGWHAYSHCGRWAHKMKITSSAT